MGQSDRTIEGGITAELDEALRKLERDDHRWSNRPCRTCAAVGKALGRPFGCSRYFEIKQEIRERRGW